MCSSLWAPLDTRGLEQDCLSGDEYPQKRKTRALYLGWVLGEHWALGYRVDAGVLCRWQNSVGHTGAELPAPKAASTDQLRLYHQGCASGLSGGESMPSTSLPMLSLS